MTPTTVVKGGMYHACNFSHNEFTEKRIILDKKIEPLVHLLRYYGFDTNKSSEGCIDSHPSMFRLFWPYVEINLSFEIAINLEDGSVRRTDSKNHVVVLKKLQNLLESFNRTSITQCLELIAMPKGDSLTSIATNFDFMEAIKWRRSIKVLLCDAGVPGILSLPQEFLTEEFKQVFLARTQSQMELFTDFLRWHEI